MLQGCRDKNELNKSISDLIKEESKLRSEISSLKEIKYSLDNKLNELKIYEKGKTPKYHIILSFTPTTLRLSNAAINSFDVELTVDKTFYEAHNENENYGRMKITKKWATE